MKKLVAFVALAFMACGAVADQAKAADKSATLQDDGTCWAVTEGGTRCRHKKDGESDYCKQHGPDVKATKPIDQCRAMKWDGQRCGRKPQEGYLYCAQHRKLGANAAAKSDKEKTAEKPKATKKNKAAATKK